MREMLDEEGRNGKAKTEMQQGRTGHGQGQEQRPQGLAALNFKTDLASPSSAMPWPCSHARTSPPRTAGHNAIAHPWSTYSVPDNTTAARARSQHLKSRDGYSPSSRSSTHSPPVHCAFSPPTPRSLVPSLFTKENPKITSECEWGREGESEVVKRGERRGREGERERERE